MYKTGLLATVTLLFSLTASGAARAMSEWSFCAVTVLQQIS